MNNDPGRRYSILFDWGTTNLRAYLIDDSGRIIDCYAAKLGVKHVSRDEYPSIIRRIAGEWVKQYAVATIVLAGMVGGNLGWRDVPMVQSPAGAEQIAAGMFQVDLMEMPPVKIVPGVFCKSAAGLPGMMRGRGSSDSGGGRNRAAQLRVSMPSRYANEMGGGGGRKNPEYRDFNDRRNVRPDNVIQRARGRHEGLGSTDRRPRFQERPGDRPFRARRSSVHFHDAGAAGDRGRTGPRPARITTFGYFDRRRASGSFGVKESLFIVGETTLAGLYAEAVRFFGRTAATIDSTKSFIGGASLLLRSPSATPRRSHEDCARSPESRREPRVV